ncbi:uncharacterized protein [Dermacentor albipictus]|uniref:uncharacterized protein n=1 Tax=Dermacentor albipictus TaxID=60249 RepID=UPI0038FC0CA5
MASASRDYAESSFEVKLYVYDRSKGPVKQLSPVLPGKHQAGRWQTSIVVHGTECSYGPSGIGSCPLQEKTALGKPSQVISLGRTEIPRDTYLEYVRKLGESSYKASSYDLSRLNCNHFSQDVALCLTGKSIPAEFLELSDELKSLGSTPGTSFECTSSRASKGPRSPCAARERTETSPSLKRRPRPQPGLARGGAPRETSSDAARSEEKEDESGVEQPVFYPQVDGIAAFKELEGHLNTTATTENERSQLHKLCDFVATGDNAWELGPELLDLLEKLLTSRDVTCAARLSLLRMLQAAALADDVVLLLHQDRRKHVVMNHVNRIAQLSPQEQDEVLKLLCNLCSHDASCEWLLYITEWRDNSDRVCSNAKATVRAVVHGLLSDRPIAQEFGAALVFNLATRQLFDDAAERLSAAIAQFLQGDLGEEQAYRSVTALRHLLRVNYDYVSAKIRTIMPYLRKLSGFSERVKKQVGRISSRISASTSRRHK